MCVCKNIHSMWCCFSPPTQMMLAAAQACADVVDAAAIAARNIYPPLDALRHVSAHVAAAVAAKAYEQGVAQLRPQPADLLEYIRNKMWYPHDDVL